MKKLLFIALMFGFLAGNAQQARPLSGPISIDDPFAFYKGINPGFPSEIERYRNEVMKPDNIVHPGYPGEIDEYLNEIMKPDNIVNPGFPIEFDQYRNKIMKPDNVINPGFPSVIDKYRNKIMRTY
jgi:hypothetical protein